MGMIEYLRRISQRDLSRLEDDPDQIWELTGRGKPQSLSLEKEWHALHTLLVGAAGDDAGPASFLLHGGRELGDSGGYGPPRLFDNAETRRIDEFLRALSDDQFWSTYDATRFEEEHIYPDVWDEPEDDLREGLVDTFHEMRDFIAEAARSGDSLVFVIL